jgi:CBS domain-containing protein
MPHRPLMPGVVTQQILFSLRPDDTVRHAAQLMAEHHIGALLVQAEGRLVGIFTERDLMTRVVAPGLVADDTLLDQVMTPNPDSLPPHAKAIDALNLMNSRGYRHIPVVDPQGGVLAIISIRDLFAAIKSQLEEEVREREAFIFGSQYSSA